MKAIVINEAGPPENLILAEVPDPEPGPGEVVVRVSYAGVNHGDIIRRRRGLFPVNAAPPYVLGLEGVGYITKLGKGVGSLKVNQRVGFLVENGAYGQLVRVPVPQVFPLPENITESVVAGSICIGTTAWQLLRLASPQRSQFLLVHGGAGGVGAALIQLCKKYPVHVIATVGSESKAAYASALEANDVINYQACDFAESVLSITGGIGVHTIFDGIGKNVVDGNFHCLRKGGLLLYYGSTSGHPQFPADQVLMNSLRVEGFVIFHLFGRPNLWNSGVKAVLGSLDDGSLKVSVDVLPMGDVGRAHTLIEERKVVGKLVLDMR